MWNLQYFNLFPDNWRSELDSPIWKGEISRMIITWPNSFRIPNLIRNVWVTTLLLCFWKTPLIWSEKMELTLLVCLLAIICLIIPLSTKQVNSKIQKVMFMTSNLQFIFINLWIHGSEWPKVHFYIQLKPNVEIFDKTTKIILMANIITFSNPQRHHPWLEGGLKFLKKGAGSLRIKKVKRFSCGFIKNGLASHKPICF